MKRSKITIGDRFGRLVVVKKTDKRMQGNIVWKCLCDCGKSCEVATVNLTKGKVVSCGCKHDEGYSRFNDDVQRLGAKELDSKRIDGTSVHLINAKVPTTNKTGHKGVSKGIRKRYRATLQFQGKQYHGGEYDTLNEAIEARKQLEEKYFQPILDKINKPTP